MCRLSQQEKQEKQEEEEKEEEEGEQQQQQQRQHHEVFFSRSPEATRLKMSCLLAAIKLLSKVKVAHTRLPNVGFRN